MSKFFYRMKIRKVNKLMGSCQANRYRIIIFYRPLLQMYKLNLFRGLFRLKLPHFLLPDIRTNTRTCSVTEIVIKAALAKKSLFRVKNLAFKEHINFRSVTSRQTCTLFSQHETFSHPRRCKKTSSSWIHLRF
jgi:hypothetical protein